MMQIWRSSKGTVGEWIRCIEGLPYAKDLPRSIKYHLNLTTRGYRALVYRWASKNSEQFFLAEPEPEPSSMPCHCHLCGCSGDHDLMVPFLGTQAWIRSLNFSIVDDWRAWHLKGQAAGLSHLTPFFFSLTYTDVYRGFSSPAEYTNVCQIKTVLQSNRLESALWQGHHLHFFFNYPVQVYDNIRQQFDLCDSEGSYVPNPYQIFLSIAHARFHDWIR